ncbi:DUF4303 domain-containing protein [Acinetobacter bereziniae]|uniref:DUF4303 domain-containing protein n=1 Tax=Acinetobacter bereziniae TaxID=106648 RepID=UPI000C2C1264|nr:DUF4303 domain-containing protein [Acinetobacter bereziniae]ATZ63652.1 hypothetical protein BSR55_09960 [Acinetobacter bereziniae]MCV2444890.1 DUF4303 domain-containing protein [Acinetobacter bereziniae]
MIDWQSTQIDFLKECIINETTYLYNYMKDKKDEIYAVSLIIDSDILTAYLAVSTYGSLKNKHKKKKWDSEEWLFTITDDIVKPCLDNFTQIIVKRYREEIIPKFKDGFKYTDEKKANLEMYIESLKQAKLCLTEKIDPSFNNVVFFINLPGEPKIIKKSAKIINEKSELLNELLKEI